MKERKLKENWKKWKKENWKKWKKWKKENWKKGNWKKTERNDANRLISDRKARREERARTNVKGGTGLDKSAKLELAEKASTTNLNNCQKKKINKK